MSSNSLKYIRMYVRSLWRRRHPLLMRPLTDVVNSLMPLDESLNIFHSVLMKLSCSLASGTSCLRFMLSNSLKYIRMYIRSLYSCVSVHYIHFPWWYSYLLVSITYIHFPWWYSYLLVSITYISPGGIHTC
jgi:hypothetical protein